MESQIHNILASVTEHALWKFTDDILKCSDDKNVAIATLMDLRKAFDCVDHEILWTKIKRYGVHSTPLWWVSSYLSNRKHNVTLNQIQSTSLNLNIGVPQGSILGPLLFLIYIYQISMIFQKNSKSCGIIYRIRHILDIKSKRLIYYSLIHPYLTYCVNVWSSTYRTNLKIACTAQKRSVRALLAILHMQQLHSRDIFLNKKMLSLDKLINQQEGILVYKVINGTYLLGRHYLHRYQLRNDENLRIPLHSTTHSQLFIHYRAVKIWNSLPDDLRSASSLSSFRNKLKLMLHQQ